MSIIDVCVDKLVHAIKNGVVYKQYCTALEEIKAVPGLKEQVDAAAQAELSDSGRR